MKYVVVNQKQFYFLYGVLCCMVQPHLGIRLFGDCPKKIVVLNSQMVYSKHEGAMNGPESLYLKIYKQ